MKAFVSIAFVAMLAAVQVGGVGCGCTHLTEAGGDGHAAAQGENDTCCPGQGSPCSGLDDCSCCQAASALAIEPVCAAACDGAFVLPAVLPGSTPADPGFDLLRPPIV